MKNKNLFKKILKERFFKIPGTSILKNDYEQFLWTVKDISEDLKTKIINKLTEKIHELNKYLITFEVK